MRLSLLAATLLLTSSLASAGSSAETEPKAVTLVNAHLVQPLAAKEQNRSKFSRARPAPSQRRVRLVDDKAQTDSAGESFVSFAIDEHHGWSDAKDESSWSKAAMTGCVYVDRGEVFIKRGSAFQPAAAAVGKKTKAAPARTCVAAASVSAR